MIACDFPNVIQTESPGLLIFTTDAAQPSEVTSLGTEYGQREGARENHPGVPVDTVLHGSRETPASLGAGHEERAGLVESRRALEVEPVAIRDIGVPALGMRRSRRSRVSELVAVAIRKKANRKISLAIDSLTTCRTGHRENGGEK